MDKAAKLKSVSATEPAIEQPLPVGFLPAPSSGIHSITEQQDDDRQAPDEAVAKGEDDNVEQVCQFKFVSIRTKI